MAAFNVGKNSKFIYPGYFMLTLNGSLSNPEFKLNQHVQCYLLNADGTVQTIQIPFHLILSDKSNRRVRDTILLKKFKQMLRNASGAGDTDKLWHDLRLILKDFKTASIKQEALERLINTDHLAVSRIHDVMRHELEQLERRIATAAAASAPGAAAAGRDDTTLSAEQLKLVHFCRFHCRLIRSYAFVVETKKSARVAADEKTKKTTTTTTTTTISKLSELTQIDEAELATYLELRGAIRAKEAKSKKHTPLESIDLPKYLACFEYGGVATVGSGSGNGSGGASGEFAYQLKANLNATSKQMLGHFYFSQLLDDACALDDDEPDLDAQRFQAFISMIPMKRMNFLVSKQKHFTHTFHSFLVPVTQVVHDFCV